MYALNTFSFLLNRSRPVGVDMCADAIKMVQLKDGSDGVRLIAGFNEFIPDNIDFATVAWQNWAIGVIKARTSGNNFNGSDVMAAAPASDVFLDVIKNPKSQGDKLKDDVLSRIKHRLPFKSENAIIKLVPTEQDNLFVSVMDSEKVSRYLAIFEKAGLKIKSMSIWPEAMVNTYVKFFGRRRADLESIALLFDMQMDCTNVVFCRYRKPLFSRSIPIGRNHLTGNKSLSELTSELSAFIGRFNLIYKSAKIERLIFFSNYNQIQVDKGVYKIVAKQLALPAQIGDCLAAVKMPKGKDELIIERRNCSTNWSVAFGLSLS